MNHKNVALVTGGNSGVGKAAAVELAKHGYMVVILCRNKQKGEEALIDIKRESGSKEIDLLLCDLGNLSLIRQAAALFLEKYPGLNILINNAGVILPGRYETSDGFELQFGVNHLGHFLLTNLLLDTLISSAPARVINVTSGAHKIGKIHFDDINLKNRFNFIKAYGQSKLANILFTYELADRLQGTGVDVNCFHPGAVASRMGINRDTGFGTTITRILKPFFQTPKAGASTGIYLATSEDVKGITGQYFIKKKAVKSSGLSYDKRLGKRLWEISEKMTGLNVSDAKETTRAI